ncbi:aldo/keto reductase [Paenibacillus sp. GYB006]|uniref:aldo/keto reductase n=1 Tax=Paenibacillus sp. GYB006 TaxID=2994394 RepID=UPI002F9640E1
MQYRKLGNTGVDIPVIGQGTWKYGEDRRKEKDEVEALRYGIRNGLNLIDTAEEYGNGGAEKIVGQAIHDIRSDVFLVTKISANNCSYKGVLGAAEASLDRLKTDYIDLYLQHWPSQHYDVAETMEAMVELVNKGIVRYIGVSNFTIQLMQEAQSHLGSIPLVCNQLAYHLHDRRIEKDILPFSKDNGITIMGYSPFGFAPHKFGMKGFPQVGSLERKILDTIGSKYDKTAYQVAMNWILRQESIVTIPKAVNKKHIDDNLKALGWELDKEDLDQIENYFPQ